MGNYSDRIEKVIEYIDSHFADDITLDGLASIANFSSYHFSRIFFLCTGTSVIKYLKDKRLEEAKLLLLGTDEKVAEIAFRCGFDSISSFNVLFKQKFARTPTQLRQEHVSKNTIEPSNIQKEDEDGCVHTLGKSLLRRVWNMNVNIKNYPEYRIAYFRHVGSYLDTGNNWNRLLEWVSKKDLFAANPLFIGISHDDPETTEEDACRHDACVTLPESFIEEQGEDIHYGSIPAGKYAEYEFYDTVDKLALAYRSLFSEWLPQSGYQLDDRPILEINKNNPADDPDRRSRCLICIPIK
jgi:AraC family transcriptional regulator